MAFFRVRGKSVTLLHGIRTPSGVRQKVLHTFPSVADLKQLLNSGGWSRFCLDIEQKFPKLAPDWDEVRRQAESLPAESCESPDEEERTRKLRSALTFVSRELGRMLYGRAPLDTLTAVGPQFVTCLHSSALLLEKARGEDVQEAREWVDGLLPDAEYLDFLVDQAKASWEDGEWREAARLFAVARQYNPFAPDTLNTEGIMWLERGKPAKAQPLFEQARRMARSQLTQADRVYSWGELEARPCLRATYNLALCLSRQKLHGEALKLYQECLERCPDDAMGARLCIASEMHRMGDYEAAIRAYRQTADDSFPDPHFDVASALLALGREHEAILSLLKGLSLNVWFAQALTERGKRETSSHCPLDSPEWAANYAKSHKDLWPAKARAFLRKLVKHTQEQLDGLVKLELQLDETRGVAGRRKVLEARQQERDKLASAEFGHAVSASICAP